ncbi:MAG: DUF4136 domain-containing protein [Gammaproteobacteria bacterium]|nr:DUF4136 domain-containing protein [Gammaproteobacteria bacterium]
MSVRAMTIMGLIVTLFGLAGCATGPRVFVNEDPSANFANYKTFGFPERLGTDDRDGYTTLLSQYLKAATTREMQARGYQLSDDPELLINFGVLTQEKIRSTTTPSYGGYYGYRGYGAWGGYDTTITQYTEGTLTIDLVDARRNQLVWEVTGTGRIRDEVRANLQPAVNDAVALLFQRYPYSAPGFSPPPSESTS